ncbi:hypothetical protein ZIOFF_071829 [Zingiber officinale]|uniref:Citrate transporter-like domain-containing protein n=1 Tax=Zingiber officinale TaxID=94328 RepID=A0A8J5CA69_ZINOF|nr:hypothetical protein ZIOFF_071829 [Zingiber officinale]
MAATGAADAMPRRAVSVLSSSVSWIDCEEVEKAMALAPAAKVALGSLAFGIFWILAVFPAVPFLPIGRTAGSLLGAMLMVAFRVISPEEAYAAVDLPILGLLFGTMVVSVFLERADMFEHLGNLLSWKSRGGKDLLLRVCVVSAVSSALFTNDTCCVVLTEFILKIARQNNLPPQPFLLALASSANIGSSTTPIGNPQNLVIAVQSNISFGKFLLGILPAMFVGVLINAGILLIYYWKPLSTEKDVEVLPTKVAAASADAVAADQYVASHHRFTPATMSHAPSTSPQDWNATIESVVLCSSTNGDAAHLDTLRKRIRASCWSSANQIREKRQFIERDEGCFFLLIHGEGSSNGEVEGFSLEWVCLSCDCELFLLMSWSAIAAALALIVLDFQDARPSLEKVSYSLLLFFCGMFITVDGFNKTGLPSALWDYMEPYARIDTASGASVLTVVILFLSNVASNVPTVLLLGARVAASAAEISPGEETKAWLMLAWVSTVAGNLSLLGSAANLIVCEQARRSQSFGYNLSFLTHLRFGFPSTIIVTAAGLLFMT